MGMIPPRGTRCRELPSPRGPSAPAVSTLVLALFAAGLSAPALAQLPVQATGPDAAFRGARIAERTATRLRVDQSAKRAVLEWQSFDIGRGHEVEFRQPDSTAIALNRVVGRGGASFIDGALRANGRIYLINQNGILFGPGARVNVHSLVASTLDMNDRIFEEFSIVEAINQDGDDGSPVAAFASDGVPMGSVECAAGCRIASARNGRVVLLGPFVENRGEIRSPEGQIVLAAAEDEVYVTAPGAESSIRGILVEVATGGGADTEHRGTDGTARTGGGVRNLGALLSERGNVSLLGLAVNQEGLVRATTSVSLGGAVRLLARDMGGSPSFTGVDVRRPDPDRTGTVTLAPGSATEVLPDDGGATAPDGNSQPRSRVELMGRELVLEGGSRVTVTGGDMTATALRNPSVPQTGEVSDASGTDVKVRVEPGAVLDVSGDDTTRVSVARNFVEVEARGNELADAPLQRDGPLRDETLTVDLRRGTELLDISGVAGRLQRGAAERLSPGGEIRLLSEGDVAVAAGATLDLRGGSVRYRSDTVSSSRLLTAAGRIVDVSEADPDVAYAGVLGDLEIVHEKWGVTETFRSAFAVREPGYLEGRDAGRLLVSAPAITLEGDLLAEAAAGRLQRRRPAALGQGAGAFSRPFDQVPLQGALDLSLLNRTLPDLVVGSGADLAPPPAPLPPPRRAPLVLEPAAIEAAGFGRLRLANVGRVVVNRPLTLPAFGSLELTATGVELAADLRIPGGSVAAGRQSEILQTSYATGGDAVVVSEEQLDAGALARITGSIDVSGVWTNDSPLVTAGAPAAPVITSGGTVRIGTGAGGPFTGITVSGDAVLNVDGGAHLAADGSFTGGAGGTLALEAGSRVQGRAARLDLQGTLRGFGMAAGGRLALAVDEVRVASGGSAPAASAPLEGARHFATAPFDEDVDAALVETFPEGDRDAARAAFALDGALGEREVLVVDERAFRLGGFASFELEATRGGTSVLPGSDVVLRTAAPVLDGSLPSAAGSLGLQAAAGRAGTLTGSVHPAAAVPSADGLSSFTRLEVLPDVERRPVDLTLEGAGNGALYVGAGATVLGDPGAVVTLRSRARVLVNGTVSAPAGTIDLIQDGGQQRRIWLGPQARLRAPGAVLVEPVSLFGERKGRVLDAGNVSVRAERGFLLGDAGARINVDAAAAELNPVPPGLPAAPEPVEVWGHAGSIVLSASEGVAYAGRLQGRAAGGGEGGRLTVRLDPTTRGEGVIVNTRSIFRMGERSGLGPHVAVLGPYEGNLPGVAEPVGEALLARAFVPLGPVTAGGFDALTVQVRSSAMGENQTQPDTPDSIPVIEFPKDTHLALGRSLELDAAVLRAGTGAASVRLRAPRVALGSADNRVRLDGATPDAVLDADGFARGSPDGVGKLLSAQPGPAALQVEGDLVELVGEVATAGFGGGVALTSAGDLRVRGVSARTLERSADDLLPGTFRTAGSLTVEAERVYPTTITDFTLDAAGEGALLRLARSGRNASAVPLSLGGSLTLEADVIEQGGALYAPLGRLTLRARDALTLTPGSLTSTSAQGVEAPFFRTQPGGDLVFPDPVPDLNNALFAGDVENPTIERPLPVQSLVLAAPSLNVAQGARLDLRGGTDARATEFVPGPGGSRDILLSELVTRSGTEPNPAFAVLPGAGAFAPYDPLETPASRADQGLLSGDTLVLEEGLPGLPAGEYALLPPRYALFGGFLVTPEPGTLDLRPGAGLSRSDRAPVLAGRFGVAGSDAVAGRARGFAVEDGSAVRRRAEYLETPLDELYAGTDVRRPVDSGTLAVEAGETLRLAGRLVPRAGGAGRGAAVDIVAERLDLGGGGDGVALDPAGLEALGAESLLVGGRRQGTAEGLELSPRAASITVAPGVVLEVPELILTADALDVRGTPGRRTLLRSGAPATGAATKLRVPGDAAVVAVSSRALTLRRTAPPETPSGSLRLAPDAGLDARGAVVADVAGDAVVAGSVQAGGGLVRLGASRVSLGEVAGVEGGLVLSNEALADLAGSDLLLRSSSVVSLYGAAGGSDAVFGKLTLDAPAVAAAGPGGPEAARLAAAELRLQSSGGVGEDPGDLDPSGRRLELAAERLVLGEGDVAVQGFGEVRLTTSRSTLATSVGTLEVDAPLVLETAVLSAALGADTEVRAQGSAFTVTGGDPAVALPEEAGLGGAVTLAGHDIRFAGRAALPSGRLELRAENSLAVEPGAVLDVSGVTEAFGPAAAGTHGGDIALQARSGDLSIAGDVVLDVSPSPLEGEAGSILLESPEATLAVAGDAVLASGARGGSLSVDAARLEAAGVGAPEAYGVLNDILGTGDFTARREVRLRAQGISLPAGTRVRAHTIRAVSDTGMVSIAGTLDASGARAGGTRADGGTIRLAAGDAVELVGTAALHATGAAGEDGAPAPGTAGGRVALIALDADDDAAWDEPGSREANTVHLREGAFIDVAGGSAPAPDAGPRIRTAPRSRDGRVMVHVRRLDMAGDDGQSDFVAHGDLGATVAGAQRMELVATRVVDVGDELGGIRFDLDRDLDADGVEEAASIVSADIAAFRQEADAFIANAPEAVDGFRVVPGLALESPGALVLEDEWDFRQDWHFEPVTGAPEVAGHLTLRATGDLVLADALTDSFSDRSLPFPTFPKLIDRLDRSVATDAAGRPLPPLAWSYALTGGADLASADPGAVMGGGALSVHDWVRTGSGDIDMASGGDVTLAEGAAIYTAGHDLGLAEEVEKIGAGSDTGFLFGFGQFNFNTWLGGGAQFPTDGGDVSVRAIGSIQGSGSPALPTHWQPRIGEATLGTGNNLAGRSGAVPAHWSIAFHRFSNGIGALGGGRLEVRAGADVADLTLAVPTTGRTVEGTVTDPSQPSKFGVALETTEVGGGGALLVEAAGDFRGGSLHLGRGRGAVRLGGSVREGAGGSAPQIYNGFDARLDVAAADGVTVGGITDATMVALSDSQGAYEARKPRGGNPDIVTNPGKYFDNVFHTYAEEASVDLRSLAGDVHLAGPGSQAPVSPRLKGVAHGGSVRIESEVVLYPSPTGQLELLAGADLTGADSEILQLDQDRTRLPSIDRPERDPSIPEHALEPVHLEDDRPNLLVAREGSIQALGAARWRLDFAKPAIFQAGTDIRRMSVSVQNLRPGDVSAFIAGRDIVQETARDGRGAFFVAANETQQSKYEIGGPGAVQFIAGRRISLGTSEGIETVGNTENRVLPEGGASLLLVAGTGDEPDYEGFLQKFLLEGESYNAPTCENPPCGLPTPLQSFLGELGLEADREDALAAFKGLDLRQQRLFVADMLLNELKAAAGASLDTQEIRSYASELNDLGAQRGLAPTDLRVVNAVNSDRGGASLSPEQADALASRLEALSVERGISATDPDLVAEVSAELGVDATTAASLAETSRLLGQLSKADGGSLDLLRSGSGGAKGLLLFGDLRALERQLANRAAGTELDPTVADIYGAYAAVRTLFPPAVEDPKQARALDQARTVLGQARFEEFQDFIEERRVKLGELVESGGAASLRWKAFRDGLEADVARTFPELEDELVESRFPELAWPGALSVVGRLALPEVGGDPGGGVSMLLSQVQTLDGGDVEMLVPGGPINAGAADSGIIDKDAGELGVVAAVDGGVGILVDEDLLVNATRVFALQGDVLTWSSFGDIDSGRGATTVASIPDPVVTIGPEGQTVVEFPPAVEGSGIRGQRVEVFPPFGTVRAGDAGITADEFAFIGEVENPDRIDVGGDVFSLEPPVQISLPSIDVTAEATSEVTESVTREASGTEDDAARRTGSEPVAIITVDVLGFGGS